MAVYMYQLAYTAESIAAQVKAPQDRLAVAKQLVEAAGGKLLAGGYSFGEYDLVFISELPDNSSAAALALTVAAGGTAKAAKTTPLMSGAEFVEALKKAQTVGSGYRPAR